MRRILQRVALMGAVAGVAACESVTGPGPVEDEPIAVVPVDRTPDDGVPPAAREYRIAFVSTRGGRSQWPDIHVADVDGRDVRRLTVGREPAWSPDGSRLVLYRDENPYDRRGLYIVRMDGSGEQYIGGGRNPSWSSGGLIAYSFGPAASGGAIGLLRPDGTALGRLVEPAWTQEAAPQACDDAWFAPYVDHPVWSPDGRTLAFVLSCFNDWSQVYTVGLDGRAPRLVVESLGARAPAWSPDGSRLALFIEGTISTIDMASGARTVHHRTWLPQDGALAWTRGDAILFQGGEYDRDRIYTLSLASGEVRQLIPDMPPGYYRDFDVAVMP